MAVVLDFETRGIGARPEEYPPKPVGLAVKIDNQAAEYLPWGHNPRRHGAKGGTWENLLKARKILRKAFDGGFGTVLFHNGPFDIEVGMTHMGLPWPKSWGDTMILAFLNNPRDPTLSLKPLCTKYLGMKQTTKDELRDWILKNVAEATPKNAMAYIWEAPPSVAGPYASDDVIKTRKLANFLGPKVASNCLAGKPPRMMEAYQRELALAPITMRMEQTGVRVDVARLQALEPVLVKMLGDLDKDLTKRLGGEKKLAEIAKRLDKKKEDKPFNMNSGAHLGEALIAAGKLARPTLTKTGKQSVAMDTLINTCADTKLVDQLALRSVADKYLTAFVHPWIVSASRMNGYINPRFNQIRGRNDEGQGGTRTGRYSCESPNLQQVPADIGESKNGEVLKRLVALIADYGVKNFLGLRDYFLPDSGALWVALDYNQQELRILAHFEGGQLMLEYLKNPDLDVHSWVRDLIRQQTGIDYSRKFVKTVVFGLLYGMGKIKLSKQLGISVEDANNLKNNVLNALPNVKMLMQQTKYRIETFGGRIYEVEDPIQLADGEEDEHGAKDEGTEFTFEHRQLNYLIQGSAADIAKQGMLQVHQRVPEVRIALQIHDEIDIQAYSMADVSRAVEALCDIGTRVKMTAKSKISKTTWAQAR